MNKADIIRKLTSRKFWAAIASFVTLIMTANGATESTAAQVTSIIMAGATVIAYILAEGLTDSAGIEGSDTVTDTADEDMNDTDDTETTEGVG